MSDAQTLTGPVKGGRKFYRQLLDMQDVLYTSALGVDTDPSERAACARAWEVLEERKRIMRGRPLPGSLKPTETHKRKARDAAAPIVSMPRAHESDGPQASAKTVNGAS